MLGLDQHLPRQVGAAGAARHLQQGCKQALRRAVISGEQGTVAIEHPDQSELGEVVTLGQHLRADQDVGFAGVDGFEQGLPGAPGARAVTIHAQNARRERCTI